MSHTEQMREAEAKLDQFLGQFDEDEQERILRYALDHIVPKLKRPALTAPAAEVPEAMGDEQLANMLTTAYGSPEWSMDDVRAARALIAARDAQWQSTRLRGGVPDQLTKQVMDALRDGLSVCMSVSICRDRKVVRDDVTLYAQTEEWCRWLETEVGPKIRAAVDALTAAPQAPAAAVDAGAAVSMLARHISEWHEDDGCVMWWAWNGEQRQWAGEPAWIGSPLSDDWPGYHTHWTPHPSMPIIAAMSAQAGGAA